MKDKELEKRFGEIERDRGGLTRRIADLEDGQFVVRRCPSCEHDTIHQFYPLCKWNGFRAVYASGQSENFHRCLNCGADWVYSTETVATKYKPLGED